jgi:hypothetical protein
MFPECAPDVPMLYDDDDNKLNVPCMCPGCSLDVPMPNDDDHNELDVP